MVHRTQLYLDDDQYRYLKDTARREKKSIARLVREWIEQRRQARVQKGHKNDALLKVRGLFASGQTKMAELFDDYLYGDRK